MPGGVGGARASLASTRFGRAASERTRKGTSPASYLGGEPSTGQRGTGDRTPECREVCVMQSAETVLEVLREITE